MRSYRSKNQFFAMFLLGGFLIGILYANLISDRYIMSGGIFDDGFLKQYAKTDIVAEEYLWYILRARLVPFCVICILGCMKWKKTVVGLCICWTGFSGGVVAVSSVISLGMKGILLCIVGMLPQILFYGFAYVILLWYLYTYPNGRWNIKKTAAAGISMAVGMILEVYTNPILMKLVIGLL